MEFGVVVAGAACQPLRKNNIQSNNTIMKGTPSIDKGMIDDHDGSEIMDSSSLRRMYPAGEVGVILPQEGKVGRSAKFQTGAEREKNMKRVSWLGGSVAAIVFLSASGFANAAVIVGVDNIAGAYWRTNAQLETDQQYGTDGYKIYGINQADGIWTANYTYNYDQTVLPSYITGISVSVQNGMYSGSSTTYGQMQDPGNGNALTYAPLLSSDTSGTADSGAIYTISTIPNAVFRLTILAASEGARDTQTWVTDSSGMATQTGTQTVKGMVYHVYDVNAGSSGLITVEYTPQQLNNYDNEVTGFAFDAIPEPASLSMFGAAVAVLLGRRRRVLD